MKLRETHLKRLKQKDFDVLIIGGGINGAASAAALSAKGVKTALIDRSDFGGYTSQSSSNLIWGGIKYLESYELSLVRQLCRSRNQLIRAYPSAIHEIRFYTNLEQGLRFPAWLIYLGTLLYWLIGFFQTRPPRFLTRARIATEEPAINTEYSIGGVEYSDAYLVEHDSRFVFQFVRKALKHGCACVNYVESLSSRRSSDGSWITTLKDHVSGAVFDARSKVLINACGPFVDSQNKTTGQPTDHHHVYSKGVHLVLKRITPQRRVLTFFADDGRMFFSVPLGTHTMVGTTDTRVPEPSTEVTEDDRRFVLENINKRLNLTQPLTKKDIIAERCGVRPLVLAKGQMDQDSEWTKLSRRHSIDADFKKRHLSVFGGKLTDCLNIGEEVCQLIKNMGVNFNTHSVKWYGEPEAAKRALFFHRARGLKLDRTVNQDHPESIAEILWRRYSEEAFDMLEEIRDNPSLSEPILGKGELTRCEIGHLAREEMIVTMEDLLRRRTRLALIVPHDELKQSKKLREAANALFGSAAQQRWQEYFQESPDLEENVRSTHIQTTHAK